MIRLLSAYLSIKRNESHGATAVRFPVRQSLSNFIPADVMCNILVARTVQVSVIAVKHMVFGRSVVLSVIVIGMLVPIRGVKSKDTIHVDAGAAVKLQ